MAVHGGGGGIIGKLLLAPMQAIFWVTVLLVAVGALGTAAAFSDVSIRALFTGMGVVISDLDEIGGHIDVGERAGEARDRQGSTD